MKLLLALLLTICSSATYGSIINNGTYTTDTATQLDWLDLTATSNLSYNDVSPLISEGGDLSGWRRASVSDVVTFFGAFGFSKGFSFSAGTDDPADYAKQDALEKLFTHWGILKSYYSEDGIFKSRHSMFILAGYFYEEVGIAELGAGIIAQSNQDLSSDSGYHYVAPFDVDISPSTRHSDRGSALIRTSLSAVPIPPSIILFASSLLSLIYSRRRHAQS